jgi:hypothetical protein
MKRREEKGTKKNKKENENMDFEGYKQYYFYQ